MKLVLIKWMDAQADLGWQEANDVQVANPPVLSVGWITKTSKSAIILAGDITDGGTNRRIEIPRGMVSEMVELNPKEVNMAKKKKPKKKPLAKKPARKK